MSKNSKKIKLYTKTVYGQVFKGGVFKESFENDFIRAKHEAEKAEGCVGLAVYERDVYLDGSMSEETKKIVIFGPALVVSKYDAIKINKRDQLGYTDIERLDAQEYYHVPAKGALFPKDKLTLVLDRR